MDKLEGQERDSKTRHRWSLNRYQRCMNSRCMNSNFMTNQNGLHLQCVMTWMSPTHMERRGLTASSQPLEVVQVRQKVTAAFKLILLIDSDFHFLALFSMNSFSRIRLPHLLTGFILETEGSSLLCACETLVFMLSELCVYLNSVLIWLIYWCEENPQSTCQFATQPTPSQVVNDKWVVIITTCGWK